MQYYIKRRVYLDIDSDILIDLNFIQPDDKNEKTTKYISQWAMFYEKGQFLKETIRFIVHNIQHNKLMYATTGPSIYTSSTQSDSKKDPDVSFRMTTKNYKGKLNLNILWQGY